MIMTHTPYTTNDVILIEENIAASHQVRFCWLANQLLVYMLVVVPMIAKWKCSLYT